MQFTNAHNRFMPLPITPSNQRVKNWVLSALCAATIAFSGTLGAKPYQLPLDTLVSIEPNVMIMLDTSGSMNTVDEVGGESRLASAKSAIRSLLEKVEDVRFCLSTIFGGTYPHYNDTGARMTADMVCTSDPDKIAAMRETVNNFVADGGTPLAASYYDVTRYFRGKGPYFGQFIGINNTNNNPIQYRCQANSMIVVTDGEPSVDWRLKGGPIRLDTEAFTTSDGVRHSFTTTQWNKINPRNWDETDDDLWVNGGNRFVNQAQKVIDDLALFGNQIDLVPTETHPHAVARATDLGGGSFDHRDHKQQNLITHTVGVGLNSDFLADTARKGKGTSITVDPSDEGALLEALESLVLSSANSSSASGSGAAQAAVHLQNNALSIYLTQYDTNNWSGDLNKIEITEDPSTRKLSSSEKWSAKDKLDTRGSARKIFTQDDGNAVAFTYANLSAAQRADLGGGLSERNAQRVIAYLRGNDGVETQHTDSQAGDFALREDRDHILGDLVHSKPTYIQNKHYGYIDPDGIAPADSYAEYRRAQKTRVAMIYVGANDGMLHAFNDEGEEVFAYVPNALMSDIGLLASRTYSDNHQFFVNGEITALDAKLGGDWATVLASPLGAGGKGLFMLDITNPNAAPSTLFKWEIDHNTIDPPPPGSVITTDWPYSAMGYMINPPKIGRVRQSDNSEKWYLFAGNGIHSEDLKDLDAIGKPVLGKASVYVIDLEDGKLVQELVLDNGRVGQSSLGESAYNSYAEANGATSVAAVDVNGDSYINRLYAADLKGQLWRINYDQNTGEFAHAFVDASTNPKPIFEARGQTRSDPSDGTLSGLSGDFEQPITAELTVTASPKASGNTEGEVIFFGTGQYFDLGHILEPEELKVQSMYSVWDRGNWHADGKETLTREDLQAKQITNGPISASGQTRSFSDESVDYNDEVNPEFGWYMDLPDFGERITRKAQNLFEYISFVTQLPAPGDPCFFGTESWAMLAQKDTAAAIGNDLGDGSETIYGGFKQAKTSIRDPIWVEQSNGQISAPVLDTANLDNSDLQTAFAPLKKVYTRGALREITP